MRTKAPPCAEATPMITWWLVGISISVVVCTNGLLPILAALEVSSSLVRPEDRTKGVVRNEPSTSTKVALVEALQSSLHDPTWDEVEHRDALCDALIHNTRSALVAGAFAADERRWFAWLPHDDVRAGLAYRALIGGDDTPSSYVRLRTLLHDPRWRNTQQRGPLCHALVSTQAELELLW